MSSLFLKPNCFTCSNKVCVPSTVLVPLFVPLVPTSNNSSPNNHYTASLGGIGPQRNPRTPTGSNYTKFTLAIGQHKCFMQYFLQQGSFVYVKYNFAYRAPSSLSRACSLPSAGGSASPRLHSTLWPFPATRPASRSLISTSLLIGGAH